MANAAHPAYRGPGTPRQARGRAHESRSHGHAAGGSRSHSHPPRPGACGGATGIAPATPPRTRRACARPLAWSAKRSSSSRKSAGHDAAAEPRHPKARLPGRRRPARWIPTYKATTSLRASCPQETSTGAREPPPLHPVLQYRGSRSCGHRPPARGRPQPRALASWAPPNAETQRTGSSRVATRETPATVLNRAWIPDCLSGGPSRRVDKSIEELTERAGDAAATMDDE